MSCDTYFTRENVVDVDAAVIGISRKSWKAIEDKEAEAEKAREIMRKERFDILPIESDFEVKEYFHTDLWGDFSSISRKQILDADVIDCRTSLRDLIEGFVSQSRQFFFLGDDKEEVVGLVSIVHLNERKVKVYLFNLLSELEIRLSHFLSSRVSEKTLLEMKFETSDEQNDKGTSYEKIKEHFKSDVKNGVDVPFTEYLYLSNFIRIIRKQGLHKDLGYSGTKYDKKLDSLVDLRHKVAHPNRSIVKEPHSVEKLWRRIVRIEEAVDKN